MIKRLIFVIAALCVTTLSVAAQSANIALGTGAFDSGLPVEVTADELSIDQTSGQAMFKGNVLVVQGEVRMSAGSVTIEYAQDGGSANGIARLLASGGVTFVTSSDAAEANQAIYSVADGTVTLDGDVILTQGQSAISGDRLIVNLASGDGRIEGRVKTVFSPRNDN